jgi:predicted RNA binding protein YcfA (HicA-like mRNA interferase family)
MNAKEVIRLLNKNGWVHERTTGSHYIFSKEGINENISVPVHGNRNIAKGTLHIILKTAGLK